jgi:nitrite reductase (cytochrome c-552)
MAPGRQDSLDDFPWSMGAHRYSFMTDTPHPASSPLPPDDSRPDARRRRLLIVAILVTAIATIGVAALLISIAERRSEARRPFVRVVEVDEHTIDPAAWGANWPHQYDTYRRTVDYERTRYGGSDAIPKQKLDADPWLRAMWAGYAFSLDYRESRGHAYMLHDQDHTERVAQRPQPGACLHCHASILPAYRFAGDGDIMEGFRKVNAMSWNEARHMTDAAGEPLVTHPVSCVDCHDPDTMRLRVTRPAFLIGMQALARSDDPVPHLPSVEQWRQGTRAVEYDVNALASRHEMRSFSCAQCHVEYYFTPPDSPAGRTQLVYPWHRGLKVEQAEAYYDEIGYSDWTHAITGGRMLKAQHPEFEVWSQGIHARAGVSCADCHMPFERVGAMKISNHHVRSPLTNIAQSCQVCHNVPESELLARAHTTQNRTQGLIDRGAAALVQLIDAVTTAQQEGVPAEQLAEALQLQRRAQWRIDYVYSEGSHGFHAPQETARILAEALDYARQGEAHVRQLLPPGTQPRPVQAPLIESATPTEAAPPGPTRPGGVN